MAQAMAGGAGRKPACSLARPAATPASVRVHCRGAPARRGRTWARMR